MADYLTLAELKRYLPDLGTADDPVLEDLIKRSSKDIDRLTGQFFDLQTTNRTFDGSGTSLLLLPWAWPLQTVTTLEVKSGGEGTSFVTVTAADYYIEPANRPTGAPARYIEFGYRPTGGVGVFPFGKGTVKVTGTWGHTTVPEDIKQVCADLVIRGYRQRAVGGAEDSQLDQIRSLAPRTVAVLREHGWQRSVYA